MQGIWNILPGLFSLYLSTLEPLNGTCHARLTNSTAPCLEFANLHWGKVDTSCKEELIECSILEMSEGPVPPLET